MSTMGSFSCFFWKSNCHCEKIIFFFKKKQHPFVFIHFQTNISMEDGMDNLDYQMFKF